MEATFSGRATAKSHSHCCHMQSRSKQAAMQPQQQAAPPRELLEPPPISPLGWAGSGEAGDPQWQEQQCARRQRAAA